jgi:hypothetical protein
VPTGCAYCTVNLFNLDTFKTIYGPSGWGSERNLAWSPDGRWLVTDGRPGAALLDVTNGSVRQLTVPAGLPRIWPHTMRATVGSRVTLIDTVTGDRFTLGR